MGGKELNRRGEKEKEEEKEKEGKDGGMEGGRKERRDIHPNKR